jgi:hypothetical protein
MLIISPVLLIDYLAYFPYVSQVQMLTPHQMRFSVMQRRPFPTTTQSSSQQKSQLAFCKTYPALLVPYTKTHRKGEKYEITG